MFADRLDFSRRCWMIRGVPKSPSSACARPSLPDYIDAMFNLALMLQRTGAYAEAAGFWRRYLASDRSSEWPSRAALAEGLRDPSELDAAVAFYM
jgi:hypothetical protein